MTAYIAYKEQAAGFVTGNHFGAASIAYQHLDPRQGELMVQIAMDIMPGVNTIMQQGNIQAIASKFGTDGQAMLPGSY